MKKKILLLIILVFFLNLGWEVGHSLVYDWSKAPLENNVSFYVGRILLSSLGDLALISVIFLIVSLKNRNISWINKPKRLDYMLIMLFGLLFAIAIEWRAKAQGRWFYTQSMPTIFGIGITPLVQLAATSILALWLIREEKIF